MAEYIFERDSKLFQKCFDGGEVLTRAKREILRGERRKDNVRRASTVTTAAVPGNVWEIRHGDCVQHLKTVPQKSYRLAFADSPYNIGVDYGDGKKADQRDPAEFLKWCGEWMGGVYQALTSDGSFWVLINHEWASHFEILLEKAGFHIRAWITWYESFGINCLNNFNRTSRRLFYCVKNKGDFVFNAEHFNRPSDRQAIHEVIRKHSLSVADAVSQGKPNDLLTRLAADATFAGVDATSLKAELQPSRYTGRSAEQVTEFLAEYLDPLVADARARHAPAASSDSAELRV